ncbi:hypothetical protein AQUCO_04000059v1 [Aquilegia coerulea]|uniref:Uncharacterized protein n=1 Tax=Aquilegia coerulea TaxID=218851 RepID=A0A2G5CR32_AQUCA|nr:hypothetical protein AQUCO_04000059v1 [Aquilegia coerulea]
MFGSSLFENPWHNCASEDSGFARLFHGTNLDNKDLSQISLRTSKVRHSYNRILCLSSNYFFSNSYLLFNFVNY